jgi:conjugative transfer signal peptidase TraF
MTRVGWLIATSAGTLGAVSSALFRPLPKLIWNASASVPIGLYAVHPAGALHEAELVLVQPTGELTSFLDGRHYLPKGAPMLKRVLALPGQTVCRADRAITVDGIAMGEALDHDRRGRPLPVWQGCQRIPDGDVFLMNRQSADSFDGRYFGLLPVTAIVGRADPLWTPEED